MSWPDGQNDVFQLWADVSVSLMPSGSVGVSGKPGAFPANWIRSTRKPSTPRSNQNRNA